MGKIRILHHWVPEYRIALYERVGRHYSGCVEIWASNEGMDPPCILKNAAVDYNHPFKYMGPISWQKGMSLRGLKAGRDVVVINGDIRELSSLWSALKAKLLGIKVLWWAQHRGSSSSDFSTAIRLFVSKLLSDAFLCYTKTGIRYLTKHGFKADRVFATGNTIDQEPIVKELACWTPQMVESVLDERGLAEKNYFLCCGFMRPKVHLDVFIRAMTSKPLLDLSLVVIGDGEMKEEYVSLASSLGVGDRIVWLPSTHDQHEMAPWFLGAKAFVYPGGIGLSILHAFSYGLPVIVHGNVDHQMPEFEVMEDGKTGYTFNEGDVDDLTRVSALILSDEAKRRDMGRYAKKVAFEKYSMNQMVANFCEAIDRTFDLYKKHA